MGLEPFSSEGLFEGSVFDFALAALIPLAILLVLYRIGQDFNVAELRELISYGFNATSAHGPFSLNRAYRSYTQYSRMSANELYAKRASYGSLGRAHKRLGNRVGYPAKLDRLQNVADLNATVVDGIAELAANEFGLGNSTAKGAFSPVKGDLERVREALKHYVRDWSTEGTGEREKIFTPILDVLGKVDPGDREYLSVLIPGCGLGRLAWEISELGFDTTANELSYFMILAFRFLVSPDKTTAPNEHAIRPYAHWFSHQRSNDALFRSVRFPDVVPRLSEKFKLVEGDFLKLPFPSLTPSSTSVAYWKKQNSPEASGSAVGYDYIVTLFFIDTSLDVLTTMEHIYHLLKPGGAWINLGPLLWTGGGQTKLELSLEEVFASACEIGFIEDRSIEKRTVECEYTGDLLAMMRWIYRAEFWVMRRPTKEI
ncbi:hypothetical protein AX15_004349 [Amanita polypyramis BW_CC]|nr:hypothetical protein AX15_004349 [Amanita polypyramis BW_CC]